MAEQRYLLHGVRIVSELVLTDVRPDAGSCDPQVRITLGRVPEAPPHAIALRAGRFHWDGQCVLLSIPGTARFAITRDEIRVEPDGSADSDSVQMMLLGTAWGTCCHLRDCLLLHASAAVVGTTCIAFLGNSGAGKSTLAASLAARGHLLAADDTCVLVTTSDGTHLHPGPRQVKLWREGLALLANQATQIRPAAQQPGKFKLSLATQWLEQPRAVRRLLLLDRETPENQAGFVRLAALDALQTLAAHTFRPRILALLGREQRHFALCAAVAANTEVYRWIRPWGMERRLQMLAMLEDWLDGYTDTSIAAPNRIARTNTALPDCPSPPASNCPLH